LKVAGIAMITAACRDYRFGPALKSRYLYKRGSLFTVVWLITALAAAIISSFANIVDSHLVSKKMPSLFSFMIPMGLTQINRFRAVIDFYFLSSTNPGWAHLLNRLGVRVAQRQRLCDRT